MHLDKCAVAVSAMLHCCQTDVGAGGMFLSKAVAWGLKRKQKRKRKRTIT